MYTVENFERFSTSLKSDVLEEEGKQGGREICKVYFQIYCFLEANSKEYGVVQ